MTGFILRVCARRGGALLSAVGNEVLAWQRRVYGVWLALRGCRAEAAFWRGLLSFDVVILKADHF